jgi:ATP-dependent Zn protease
MYVEDISLECQQVLLQAYNYCRSLLDTHRHQYKILLAQLKNKKTISSPQEIESVLGNRDLITGLRSVKIGFV